MAQVETTLYLAYGAVLTLALIPIYLGAWKSVDLIQSDPNEDGKLQLKSQATGVDKEVLSTADAYWFPITGSCVLFGLYLIFRFLDKDHVNMLLTGYFVLIGTYALASLLADLVVPLEQNYKLSMYQLTLSQVLRVVSKKDSKTDKKVAAAAYQRPKKQSSAVVYNLKFTKLTLFTGACAAILTGAYAATKLWYLNNILGFAFAVSAVALMDLDGFKTGMVLLAGLFVYDVFWVFGTEVMVSVAKNFDAPIKMLWPKDFALNSTNFMMLGLGDIVIPGIYIALCLRFDYHNYLRSAQRRQQQSSKAAKPLQLDMNFSKPYFTTALVAYVAGLVTTVVVMHVFKAAQPALLYLSPACIISSSLVAIVRGEVKHLFAYSSEVDKKLKEDIVPAEDDSDVESTEGSTKKSSSSTGGSSKATKSTAKESTAGGKKTAAQLDSDREEAARKRKRLEAEQFDFEEQTAPPVTKRVHAHDGQADERNQSESSEEDGELVSSSAADESEEAPFVKVSRKGKAPSSAKVDIQDASKADEKPETGKSKAAPETKQGKAPETKQGKAPETKQGKATENKQGKSKQQTKQSTQVAAPEEPKSTTKKQLESLAKPKTPGPESRENMDNGEFQVVSRKKGKNPRRTRSQNEEDASASETASPAPVQAQAKASPAPAAAKSSLNSRNAHAMLEYAAEFDF